MKQLNKLLIVVIMAVILVTSACGQHNNQSGSIVFTDMVGNHITLAEPAKRIVVLDAADCEIIYALGAQDLLVGRGEYCDYPESIFSIPSISSGAETNLEQILGLNPDVLIMSVMDQSEEQANQLKQAGVEVVVINAQNIEGVYQAIKLIGLVVDKNQEAMQMIADLKAAFNRYSHVSNGKTIYFEVSPLEWGLWTAGKGTFMDEIATMMGLTNIFSDVNDWAEISEEQVIERNPDYIVTISMYYGDGPTPEEEILGRTGWNNIKAVKNKEILNLANNELSRPGPRLVDGAEALYTMITR